MLFYSSILITSMPYHRMCQPHSQSKLDRLRTWIQNFTKPGNQKPTLLKLCQGFRHGLCLKKGKGNIDTYVVDISQTLSKEWNLLDWSSNLKFFFFPPHHLWPLPSLNISISRKSYLLFLPTFMQIPGPGDQVVDTQCISPMAAMVAPWVRYTLVQWWHFIFFLPKTWEIIN